MWARGTNRMLLVVVVVVVVSVLAKRVQAETDFQPVLKSFDIYGCQANESLEQESKVAISHLGTRSKFLLGVDKTNNETYVRLLSQSSPKCRLRPNKLYCVLPKTTGNKQSLEFYGIPQDGEQELEIGAECKFTKPTETGEKKHDQSNDKRLKRSTKTQLEKICRFKEDEQISLHSGYGFISCQDDAGEGVDQWNEWLTDVAAARAEADSKRNKIIIGVMSGTAVMLVLLVVCVVSRICFKPKVPYHSARRPSNLSGRTNSTQDQPYNSGRRPSNMSS